MIADSQLDFMIKNNYNCLFEGHAGVGKTSVILEAFNRNNLKWQYFSTSTMDPWVDFIGVPKEVTDSDGKTYLELIRPKQFANDEVEAIFLDEFNRSSKKVRNAVMELIQFKSINGKKFKNLKIVWAAINPHSKDEVEYDVDKLDPAQIDRFQMKIEIPYLPVLEYFKRKYSTMGEKGVQWWKELPPEFQKLVSPRRLDYALDVIEKNGDVRMVLPKETNISKLLQYCKFGSPSDTIAQLFENKDVKGTTDFLKKVDNFDAVLNFVSKTKKRLDFFLPLISEEQFAILMEKNIEGGELVPVVEEYFIENIDRHLGTLNTIYTGSAGKLKFCIDKIKREAGRKKASGNVTQE